MDNRRLHALRHALAIALAISTSTELRAEQTIGTRELSGYLMRAINAPAGTTFAGQLDPELSDQIRNRSKSPGPFRVAITRIEQLPQSGCARLKIRYFLPQTPTVEGKSEDLLIDSDLNICLDGSPPQ